MDRALADVYDVYTKSESTSGMNVHRILMLFGLLALCAGCIACEHHDLRGTWRQSKDGKTYFAVMDDSGGLCGQIQVDGKTWAHPIGDAAPIDPGPHTISCDGDIGFSVPSGSVYKFNYWGP